MSPHRHLAFAFAFLWILSSLSCGDSAPTDTGPPADAGDGGSDADAGDTGTPPTCDMSTVPDLEAGDPVGHADPLGSAAGEARAGRIAEADLPVDPGGLETWDDGDYVLANDHIAVLIEQAGDSELYDPWGGKLVGVFSVEGGALTKPGDFNELTLAVGRYTLMPTSVGVLNDGSDGEPAIVRAVGPLRAVPFIDELGSILAPADYDDMELAIDYILAPDADAVEQRFTFRSPRPRRAAVGVPLVISMQTSRMPAFEPVGGFAVDSAEPTEWIGFVDDDATSYAYRTDSPLDFFLEQAGTLLLQPDTYMIEACGLTERGMGQVYVGAVGLDGLRAAMAREDSEAQREITGMVREADGSAAVGVRVHAELADGTYYTRTSSAADGTFALRVPEDAAVSLHGFRQGQPMAGPISVAAASSTADLMMGPVGMVDVTVTDLVSGDPLPSRIQILASPAIARPPGAFGETPIVSGRTHVVSPADGQASLLLAEGTGYTVVASRGYEYEVVSQTDVSIVAGESTAVAIALERVVDTPDVMCGDFHIHTTRSPDAVDSGRDKILSAAGEGLEIPVRTDHEYVAAFEPVITSLGLEEHIFGITSIELTTFSWGHFNVFPLTLLPEQRNAGAFDWANKLPPEVFADVRSRPESPAMIINHPRGFAIGAYFTAAQYDATTGMVGAPEMWDEEFRLVEVFNDKDFEANWDPTGESDSTVMDWFSFLNAGRRVFAVGSSDSHKLYSSPVGYPRTCIEVDTDSPATLRAMGSVLVRDRLNAGRATVSGGIYVDALGRGGAGPGDDVSAATDRETVNVRVQAANWVTASRLRVFVDGALTETIVLDDSTRDPVVPTTRFSDDLEIEVAAGGSWVVFVADGDDDLAPVHPGRMPFGVTNPIFFTR